MHSKHQLSKRIKYILGWSVGTCWAMRSSLSMCNKVVFPALSNPKNTNLPVFFIKPMREMSMECLILAHSILCLNPWLKDSISVNKHVRELSMNAECYCWHFNLHFECYMYHHTNTSLKQVNHVAMFSHRVTCSSFSYYKVLETIIVLLQP